MVKFLVDYALLSILTHDIRKWKYVSSFVCFQFPISSKLFSLLLLCYCYTKTILMEYVVNGNGMVIKIYLSGCRGYLLLVCLRISRWHEFSHKEKMLTSSSCHLGFKNTSNFNRNTEAIIAIICLSD